MQVCGNNFDGAQSGAAVGDRPGASRAIRGKALREVIHLAHHSTEFWTEAWARQTRNQRLITEAKEFEII